MIMCNDCTITSERGGRKFQRRIYVRDSGVALSERSRRIAERRQLSGAKIDSRSMGRP